ncbi:methylthioribulose 1-phosphate dehydratase [Nonomuraea cavernae]|uniref:methylthioribulose 1-phosphate dehydratase n=1 Tax=Nonomuraea cavernae TaxID=2045107 RepID=UPI0033DA0151
MTVQAPPHLGDSIARVARGLYLRGWMEGTAGNISARLPGRRGHALITASGLSKGELTSDSAVEVEADTGRPARPGGPRPSAETVIHAALYDGVPGCEAVVHAHPPYSTLVAAQAARRGADHVSFADFEIIKGLGGRDPFDVTVPVFRNWADVPRIAADLTAFLRREGDAAPPVLLIAHHGATAWGPDLETARNRLECLELLCRLHVLDRRDRLDR